MLLLRSPPLAAIPTKWLVGGVTATVMAGYCISVYMSMKRVLNQHKSIKSEYYGEMIEEINRKSKIKTICGVQISVYHHINKDSNLVPTIFLVHGFGGQKEQWCHQIRYFKRRSNIVAVDLVGHGHSPISRDKADYSSEKFKKILLEMFDAYKSQDNLFVAHSYGASLVIELLPEIHHLVKALVLLSPATDMSPKFENLHVPIWLPYIPSVLLDILRYYNRRSGIESKSVARVISENALDSIKRQQLKWNSWTPSVVVKNTLLGQRIVTKDEIKKILSSICSRNNNNNNNNNIPPILILSGQDDKIIPPEKNFYLQKVISKQIAKSSSITLSKEVVSAEGNGDNNLFVVDKVEVHVEPPPPAFEDDNKNAAEGNSNNMFFLHSSENLRFSHDDASDMGSSMDEDEEMDEEALSTCVSFCNPSSTSYEKENNNNTRLLNTTTATGGGSESKDSFDHNEFLNCRNQFLGDMTCLPNAVNEGDDFQLHYVLKNISHMPMTENHYLVNAIINKFFINKAECDILSRLHPLNRGDSVSDKWGLKNFEKWFKTQCFGSKIDTKSHGIYPMKVLRQDDSNHSPQVFFKQHPDVGLVIDLTSQDPSYDVKDANIPKYIKLAGVSKQVPSKEYAQRFISTVNSFWKESPDKNIAVHCHYGFNRTGFLVCSFLIQEEGLTVKQALDMFKKSRPDGIRHQYFLDELYLRYSS